MRKFKLSCLMIIGVLMISGVAFGLGANDENYGQYQEKSVFFNNSGSTLTSGMVVVLDRSGSGVSAGTTLGAYVTTTTSADAAGIIGVVADVGTGSFADQTIVPVITRGPAKVLCLDSSDAVSDGGLVSTSTTAGLAGGGSADSPHLGLALEAGSGNDRVFIWTWVEPSFD